MTKEEWLQEFERLNGRPATPEEVVSVWGEESAEASAQEAVEPVAEQVMEDLSAGPASENQTVAFVEGQPIEVSRPSHRLSPLTKILSAVAAVLVIAFAAFVFIQKQNANSINGTWSRSWSASEVEISSFPANFVEDVQYRMVISDGKVKMITWIDFNENSNYYDKDEIKNYLGSTGKSTFDEDKGVIEIEADSGTVDASKKEIISAAGGTASYEKRGDNELVMKGTDGKELVFTKKN